MHPNEIMLITSTGSHTLAFNELLATSDKAQQLALFVQYARQRRYYGLAK